MSSEVIKEHLVSGLQTFIATFLVLLGTAISTGTPIEWSGAAIGALILAAARGALKEVFARFAPISLGGRAK